MLTLLTLMPLVGVIILIFFFKPVSPYSLLYNLGKNSLNNEGYDLRVRQITLFTSVATFIASTIL
jgi:hypothetical protein